MACDDCQSVNQKLKKVSACADYHTSGDNCCFKNACEKYCSYKCSNCLFTNKIDIEDSKVVIYDSGALLYKELVNFSKNFKKRKRFA